MLSLESRLAGRDGGRSTIVFMSVGAEEATDMHEHFQAFADSLASRRYDGLSLTVVVLPDETHLSAFATAFVRGLRAVYR
jgi:hypothetical protein